MVSILNIWRAAAIAALFALVPLSTASADTLKTLHSFCAAQGCIDGANPNDLLRDASGNLYGTAQHGGKHHNGIVFKLIPNADGTMYTEHILHNFCAKQNCTDGAYPYGNLIMDVEGNLYGTTIYGGSQSGVVYKMTPGAQGWSYKVLHTFCDGNCADGSEPEGGLSYKGQASGALWDGTSPLFGATQYGGTGANLGNGVIYEMTTHPLMLYQVIRKFSSGSGPNPVLVDAAGNIFGTTRSGGKYGGGVLYKLAANNWHETTLHNFCNTANCADGELPEGRPIMDGAGNLFGATDLGGTSAYCTSNGGTTCGTVFERTAAGAFGVLYNFCSLPDCTDGEEPFVGIVMDASGNLFGTTFGGGTHDGGVVFKLTPDGTDNILYSFCSAGPPCQDGANAATPLVMDADGGLFGTTNNGGANGDHGTVFELKP